MPAKPMYENGFKRCSKHGFVKADKDTIFCTHVKCKRRLRAKARQGGRGDRIRAQAYEKLTEVINSI